MSDIATRRINIVVTQSGIPEVRKDMESLSITSTSLGGKVGKIASELRSFIKATNMTTGLKTINTELQGFMAGLRSVPTGMGNLNQITQNLAMFMKAVNALPKTIAVDLGAFKTELNKLRNIDVSQLTKLDTVSAMLKRLGVAMASVRPANIASIRSIANALAQMQAFATVDLSRLSSVGKQMIALGTGLKALSGGVFGKRFNLKPVISSLNALAGTVGSLSGMSGMMSGIARSLTKITTSLAGMPKSGIKIKVDPTTFSELMKLDALLSSIASKMRVIPTALKPVRTAVSTALPAGGTPATKAGGILNKKTWTDTSGAIHGTNRALHFFRTALTTIGFTYFMKLIRETTDEFIELGSRVALTADSAEDYTTSMKMLWEISDEVRSSIGSLSKLFNKFHISLKPFGATIKQSGAFVKALAQSIKISGSNMAETKAFYVQFGQAIQSGLLRGREFRSMMESNLYMSRLLAKELAGGDLGKLRQLAFSGQLDTLTVTNAVLRNQAKINKDFANVTMTISDMYELIKNELIQIMQSWDYVLGQSDAWKSGLQWIRENLQGIIVSVGAFVATTMVQLLFQFGLMRKILFGLTVGGLVIGFKKLYDESKSFRDVIHNTIDYFKNLWDNAEYGQSVIGDLVLKAKEFVDIFKNFDAELAFMALEKQLVKVAMAIDAIIHPLGGGSMGLNIVDVLQAMFEPSDARVSAIQDDLDVFKNLARQYKDIADEIYQTKGREYLEGSENFSGNTSLIMGLFGSGIGGLLDDIQKRIDDNDKMLKEYQISQEEHAEKEEIYNRQLKEAYSIRSKIMDDLMNSADLGHYEGTIDSMVDELSKKFVFSDIGNGDVAGQAFQDFIANYKNFLLNVSYVTGQSQEGIGDEVKNLIDTITGQFQAEGDFTHNSKLLQGFADIDDEWAKREAEYIKNRKSFVKEVKEQKKELVDEIKSERVYSGLFTKFAGATAIETDITWNIDFELKPEKTLVQDWMELRDFWQNLDWDGFRKPIENAILPDPEGSVREQMLEYFDLWKELNEKQKESVSVIKKVGEEFKDESKEFNKIKSEIAGMNAELDSMADSIKAGGYNLEELRDRLKEIVHVSSKSDLNFLLSSIVDTAERAKVPVGAVMNELESGLRDSSKYLKTMAQLVASGAKFEIAEDFYGKFSGAEDVIKDAETLKDIQEKYPEIWKKMTKEGGLFKDQLVQIANILKYDQFQSMTTSQKFGKGILDSFQELYDEYSDVISQVQGLTSEIFENFAEESNKFFLGLTNDWKSFAQNILKEISDTTFKMLLYGDGGLTEMLNLVNPLKKIKDVAGDDKGKLSTVGLNTQLNSVADNALTASGSLGSVSYSANLASNSLNIFASSVGNASLALAGIGTGGVSSGTTKGASGDAKGFFDVISGLWDKPNTAQFGSPVGDKEPTWVGERGAELFIPNGAGHVYNNMNSEAKADSAKSPDGEGVSIANFFDRDELDAFLNSPKGRKSIMNIVTSKR